MDRVRGSHAGGGLRSGWNPLVRGRFRGTDGQFLEVKGPVQTGLHAPEKCPFAAYQGFPPMPGNVVSRIAETIRSCSWPT